MSRPPILYIFRPGNRSEIDQKLTFLPGTGRWQREALTEGQVPLSAALSGLCPSTTRYASGPLPGTGRNVYFPPLLAI